MKLTVEIYPEVSRFQFRSCTDWSARWLRMRRTVQQPRGGEWRQKASFCLGVQVPVDISAENGYQNRRRMPANHTTHDDVSVCD